ncbi:UNVERIFIED_CONTAM: hypothetical protein PYX00_003392 [Menopon gallinae]|uniref:WD and tetratricopeptide repeats protein 1 n=1 Tax=Menopon gallinae TaxID=328185 RepID=A0AAW2I043_9NEOP
MARRTRHFNNNCVKLLNLRQIDDRIANKFQSKLHVTDSFISRLGLETELEGHTGCVNCLEWNETGSVLASASDDLRFILWDPFRHRKLHIFETRHHGNIFTIKFLPKTKDNIVVTGAGDCRIRVHDVELRETTLVCSCHTGRVKRVATAPNVPYLFWSAAEDGMIMEFDLRAPHSCSTQTNNVLINFAPHLGRFAEAKCLAINPRRPELLAVGANDPYIRLYDRRMIRPITIEYAPEGPPRNNWERYQYLSSRAENNLPNDCVQYFVAGHLPMKYSDYQKKYRNLASTYLTFSANGSELLVNLGGEQIYLFDINNRRRPKIYDMIVKDSESCSGISHANGFKKNGYGSNLPRHANGTRNVNYQRPNSNTVSPGSVEALKMDANNAFEIKHYTSAIRLYNKALSICPNWAMLYGNRAAAYMKRGWDGDMYAALRDCHLTLQLDPNHLKAHFRLAKCLHELQFTKEAFKCLSEFKLKFPDRANSMACKALDLDIRDKMQLEHCACKDIYSSQKCGVSSDDEDAASSTATTTENSEGCKSPKSPKDSYSVYNLSEQEKYWRDNACDYETRYCGHCNTTTDIKEANFFGSEGQYIVAGSDDGSFFIWDRYTTNIVQVLKGDDSVVNCLQPHPTSCLLATSGIDPVVRLWSPLPEDGTKNERVVLNLDDAALANQKRMNSDPFEVMLMNMGFRIASAAGEGEGESEETNRVPSPGCRTS